MVVVVGRVHGVKRSDAPALSPVNNVFVGAQLDTQKEDLCCAEWVQLCCISMYCRYINVRSIVRTYDKDLVRWYLPLL